MITNYLKKLVSFDTRSSKSNLALIKYCQREFENNGYQTRVWGEENKKNLYVFMPTYGPKIILSAHTDTVPPTEAWKSNPFKLKQSGDKLIGLGVCDMKSFIAIMLELSRQNHKKIAFLLTFNEETDFAGAKLVDRKIMGKSDFLIIGEPTDNLIVCSSKGLAVYNLKIIGASGHGSDPEKGQSSIYLASNFIIKLQEEFNKIAFRHLDNSLELPRPTLNIGRIKGGEALNMIPFKTELDFEIRSTSEQMVEEFDVMLEGILKKLNSQFELKKLISLAPFAASDKIRKKVRAIKIAKGASYCTEANIFSDICPNVILFGPGELSQAHASNEWVSKATLTNYQKELTEVINMIL